MSQAIEALEEALTAVIEERIYPLFSGDFHAEMRVTIMVRFEDAPTCDVLFSSDNEAGIRAVVDRRFAPDAALSQGGGA